MKLMNEIVLPSYSLWMRELIRFFRQRSRMIGVIGSPILFWFFIGSGLGTSFRTTSPLGGANYLEYFYPGTLLLIMLFTAIFSTISIIEDRKEGFLQSVLVAPISSASIALGKIFGGTTLAVIQAIIFLALAPLVGFSFTFFQFVSMVVLLILHRLRLNRVRISHRMADGIDSGIPCNYEFILNPIMALIRFAFPDGRCPGMAA